MKMNKSINSDALVRIKAGRNYMTTAELAEVLGKSRQTIRKLHCLDGAAFGIRPVKIGNALSWPVADVERLLSGEVAA